jgi:hypothetical protein
MEHYAGIDVSLESASLCVVDATGRIIREGKVDSEPEVLIGWFHSLGLEVTRIGLEAVQGNAGQDRPQGCTRHRSANTARLVPPSTLQIAASAGGTGDVDSAQAAADQEP